MNGIAQVSSPIFIKPAYGRVYETPLHAMDAWQQGKDFKVVDGPYCSIRDLETLKQSQPSGIYLLVNNVVFSLT